MAITRSETNTKETLVKSAVSVWPHLLLHTDYYRSNFFEPFIRKHLVSAPFFFSITQSESTQFQFLSFHYYSVSFLLSQQSIFGVFVFAVFSFYQCIKFVFIWISFRLEFEGEDVFLLSSDCNLNER